MTAEVAILNKSAVALAADSKVTISSAVGQKTYDTVNKLFTLSKVHPVGIMIFGSAEFMRYPWETIIKLYRAAKKSDCKDTVEEWGLDFVDFLKTFGTIAEADIAENIYNVLYSFLQSIELDTLKQARAEGININSDDYTNLLNNRIDLLSKGMKGLRDFIDPANFADEMASYSKSIDSAVKRFVGTRKNLNPRSVAKISILFLSKYSFSPGVSGFVIAGFGQKELFPTLVTYETDGYVGSQIKIDQGETLDISRGTSAAIAPFAQREMVDRFMEGIDPSYSRAMDGAFETALIDSCLAVLEKHVPAANLTPKMRAEVTRAAKRRANDLSEKAKDFRIKRFVDPIVTMVSLLPMDELANLAESLVALTSLRRRVSNNIETVGGPIDVAIISKSDGFIWIKRKQYFKPELNRQFDGLYLKDTI